ncbi:MAG: PhzF family phenazine biosynthesis protein [Lysobacteraceae bacterium]
MSRRYAVIDVFTARPLQGNPLAVMVDAEGLDAETMQRFAAWNNLSETTFLLPPTKSGADYRVRIFTPRSELPFAGHPSVGSAFVAIDSGLVDANKRELVQECAAGLLPVRIEGDGDARRVHVRAPRARPVASPGGAALLDAALAGLARGALAPALWDNGPRWWLAELADADAVRAMRPDLAAIATLTTATGAVGLAVYGRAPAGADHQLAVRAYCPADNIPEDPVTGSANACIAAQLAQAGVLPGAGGRYVASQGRELGRDGRIEIQVDGDGDAWIGGRVQCVIDGALRWDAP